MGVIKETIHAEVFFRMNNLILVITSNMTPTYVSAIRAIIMSVFSILYMVIKARDNNCVTIWAVQIMPIILLFSIMSCSSIGAIPTLYWSTCLVSTLVS